MGKLAGFFRSQGISLPVEQKQLMLSLDREFDQLEAEMDALKAENLKLQAQVNPLQREIERLKAQIQGPADKRDALDEKAEELLYSIATIPDRRFPEDLAPHVVGGNQALGDYYITLLREQHMILQVCYHPFIGFGITQTGLAYLKSKARI